MINGQAETGASATNGRHVIVVGGGYVGVRVAQALDGVADVTLIDSRERSFHKFAALRGAVQPGWGMTVQIPRDHCLKHGKVLTAEVKAVTGTEVELMSGEKLAFDYLVAATGARNTSVGEPKAGLVTAEEVKAYYDSLHEVIEAATSYVVVGGGVVGLELVGELRHRHPTKKITLVHSGEHFLDNMQQNLGKGFEAALMARLKELNVELKMGARAELTAEERGQPYLAGARTLKTSKGDAIETDLVLPCLGAKLNNGIYPAEWLRESGDLDVTATMQVVGAEKVFAGGDIAATVEDKMFAYGQHHVAVIAGNIQDLIKGKGAKKKFKPFFLRLMVLPLGPNKGVSRLGYFRLGSWVTSQLKGKDLFVGKMHAEVGEKPTLPPNGKLM